MQIHILQDYFVLHKASLGIRLPFIELSTDPVVVVGCPVVKQRCQQSSGVLLYLQLRQISLKFSMSFNKHRNIKLKCNLSKLS